MSAWLGTVFDGETGLIVCVADNDGPVPRGPVRGRVIWNAIGTGPRDIMKGGGRKRDPVRRLAPWAQVSFPPRT